VNRHNFFWLLLALLVFLIGVPAADDLEIVSRPAVRALAFSCLVAIGIWSLRGSGRPFSVGIAFVIAGIVFNVLAVNLASPVYLYASFAALFGFLLVAISFTLKQIAMETEQTGRGCLCLPAARRDLGGRLHPVGNDLTGVIWRVFAAAGPRVG
jgi:hypothetical protein